MPDPTIGKTPLDVEKFSSEPIVPMQAVIIGAVLGFLKDLLTLFTRLKQRFPLLGA